MYDDVKKMRETMFAWCHNYPIDWIELALELAKEKYFEDQEKKDAKNNSCNGG